MLKHGYLPGKIMDTVLVSLVKDKKGLLTDKNNYRPIAITSVASKILEKVILRKVEHLLNTMCYQFGFKTKHSTDLCVFAMKKLLITITLDQHLYMCATLMPLNHLTK